METHEFPRYIDYYLSFNFKNVVSVVPFYSFLSHIDMDFYQYFSFDF